MADFLGYLDTKEVLEGFNLTRDLQQKMFSHLDPHKKGYLTRSDWAGIFSR
jgi:hypothetical protein